MTLLLHLPLTPPAAHQDMVSLGCLPPTAEPKATDFIPQMITTIERIIANGHAYAVPGGDVFFEVGTLPGYGCLSGRSQDDNRWGGITRLGEWHGKNEEGRLRSGSEQEQGPLFLWDAQMKYAVVSHGLGLNVPPALTLDPCPCHLPRCRAGRDSPCSGAAPQICFAGLTARCCHASLGKPLLALALAPLSPFSPHPLPYCSPSSSHPLLPPLSPKLTPCNPPSPCRPYCLSSAGRVSAWTLTPGSAAPPTLHSGSPPSPGRSAGLAPGAQAGLGGTLSAAA